MSRGVASLATIASTAPWVGFFGTVLGITFSFRGVIGDKTAFMAAIAASLGKSLVPGAWGLLTAIVSHAFYRYARNRLAAFDDEMNCAALDLVNRLSAARPIAPSL